MPPNSYYTLNVAAPLLGYTCIQSLRNALSLGHITLPSNLINGRRVFLRDDFDEHMLSRRLAERKERKKAYDKQYRQTKREQK